MSLLNALHRTPRYLTSTILIGIFLSLLGLVSLPLPASAASCGDAETSIISCDAAKSGTAEANDSANNPIISVLVFVMQILTGAVGVAAIGALVYGGILYSSSASPLLSRLGGHS